MFTRSRDNNSSLSTGAAMDLTIDQCQRRGLTATAQWLGELAMDAEPHVLSETLCGAGPSSNARLYGALHQDTDMTDNNNMTSSGSVGPSRTSDWARRCHQVALCYFRNGEYLRCHHLLNKSMRDARTTASTSSPPPCMQFLSLYALYMDGQRLKNTSSNPHRTMNPHLRVLRSLAAESLRCSRPLVAPATPISGGSGSSSDLLDQDPYLNWLMGVVLRDLSMKQESAVHLLASVQANPLLWCAWEDLTTLVTRESQLEEMESILSSVEPRFMVDIFLASMKSSMGIAPVSLSTESMTTTAASASSSHPTTAATITTSTPRTVITWQLLLRHGFPNNPFLLSQLASFHYKQRKEFDKADEIYTQLQAIDPYRLDYTADYSDLLFMRSDRLSLSSLAQRVYQIDSFSAESNFVVGNYYVLLGQHERSLLHFRRATAIQPSFIAAWTLLGHAYVETKNTTAAIEAYRVVVEVDQRDYRGWYNLGQIYELLQVYHHALYYYWHTTSLRPTDPRMWTAVANCLEHEGRVGESIVCLERAEACDGSTSETYPATVRRISTYHIERRNFPRACVFLEKLARCKSAPPEDLLFAIPFLVQHYVMQVQQLMELPARSPSYEPSTQQSPMRPSLHYSPPDGTASASYNPHDRRLEQALNHLNAAEKHLDTLAALTQATSAEEPGSAEAQHNNTSTGGGGGEDEDEDAVLSPTASAMTSAASQQYVRFISRMRREVQLNRRMMQQYQLPI